MKECFNACGDDDVPFIDGKYNSVCMLPKARLSKADLRYLKIKDALSDKWQIKRAEPKVLSAEEMFRKRYGYRSAVAEFGDRLRAYGDDMDKNGQLREWLRPEQVELREAIEKVSKYHNLSGHNDLGNALYELKKALKNLKPPHDI